MKNKFILLFYYQEIEKYALLFLYFENWGLLETAYLNKLRKRLKEIFHAHGFLYIWRSMKRMSIIPFRKETVTNLVEIERIFGLLNDKTCFNNKLGIQSSYKTNNHRELEGVVRDKTFNIRRLLPYGYSAFTLIVSGEHKDGELVITYKFHSRVNNFLILSVSFLVFINLYSFDILSALTFPLILCLGIIIMYNIELNIIKKIFKTINH